MKLLSLLKAFKNDSNISASNGYSLSRSCFPFYRDRAEEGARTAASNDTQALGRLSTRPIALQIQKGVGPNFGKAERRGWIR
jgi:hypothetical protein